MMRLLLVVAAIAGMARADYAFQFVCRDDTVAQVAPGDPVFFRFAITNTGQSADVYAFDCRVRQNVPGWSIAYCIRGRCVEPGTVMLDSLSAGATDTTPVIDVYTGATAGEAVIEMHVRSQGNPALADSITVHALAGVGIAESQVTVPLVRPTLPGLARPGALLRVDGPVSLRDVTGRLVARGHARDGQWRLPQDIAPGIYLLRMRAGAGSRSVRIVVP
jgi:hypothetical protein